MFYEFVEMYQQIRHRKIHEQLKEDTVDHMWVVKRATRTYVWVNLSLNYFI